MIPRRSRSRIPTWMSDDAELLGKRQILLVSGARFYPNDGRARACTSCCKRECYARVECDGPGPL